MPAASTLPVLHVRPRRGWLNDPNGIVRHDGRWHVFYQHNPARAQHGEIAWAHVSSPDLVRWTEHPLAFSPQPGGPDRGGCWSGAALPWLDVPAVVYTGVGETPAGSTVCVRRALDERLETWSDPVVVAEEPAGAGIREMRDPYPFVFAGRRFALLGAGLTDGSAAVLLFSGDDPLAWRYEGVWLGQQHELVRRVAPADTWECPQLVRLGDVVVLVLSLQTERRLEDVVHLVGDLVADPRTGLPVFVPRDGGRLDEGPDFYAPQVVEDAAGPLLFGWVRQEDAADDAAPDAVAGCLTFPRRLALWDGRVCVVPDPALQSLVGDVRRVRPGPDGGVELPVRARATLEVVRAGASTDVEGGPSPVVELVSGDVRARLPLAGGTCEVWVDGEVAEVFRPGGTAGTARSPGTSPWRLEGALADCAVDVAELVLPLSS